MNISPFSSNGTEEIYKEHPEIYEKEQKLENVEKDIIEKSTQEEIKQLEQLIIDKQISVPQVKVQNDDDDAQKIIDYLFQIIKEKNLIIAIETVKKMNNPFILDKFHDKLIQEGLIKLEE